MPLTPTLLPLRAQLSEGLELLGEVAGSPRPHLAQGRWGAHWWLLLDDRPVAYCRTVYFLGEEAPLRLSEVEVKAPHRGRGHSRVLLTAVAQAATEPLYSPGAWTPEGAHALAWLPLPPGVTGEVTFRSQSFVLDWSTRRPKIL